MSDIKENKMGYNCKADNLVYTEATDDISVDELTVTITLNEYRGLIADQATMYTQIEKAEEKKFERDRENVTLKEENKALQAELYELKKKIEKLEENAASMQQPADYLKAYVTPTGTEEAEE